MSQNLVSGTFTGTGAGAMRSFYNDFNVTISGTFVATVALQRSFDQGTTWHTLSTDATGTAAQFTVPVSLIANEPENGVYYRLSCTAFTSGSVDWRLSQ